MSAPADGTRALHEVIAELYQLCAVSENLVAWRHDMCAALGKELDAQGMLDEIKQLRAKLDYAKGLGLHIGICKTSDQPDGFLAHDFTEGTDLRRMFDEWSDGIGMKEQLEKVTAERDTYQREAYNLRKDLCEIAAAFNVGVPDSEEAKKRIIAVKVERDQLRAECTQLKESEKILCEHHDHHFRRATLAERDVTDAAARAEKAEAECAVLKSMYSGAVEGRAIATRRGRSLAVMCNAYLEPIADQLEHCHNSPNEAKAIRQLLDEARTILADGGVK